MTAVAVGFIHAPPLTDERPVGLVPGLSRECRVVCLLAAVLLMSLVDLHHTLLYLQTVGMEEANPVARWVMSHDSPLLLIGFKLATVVITGAILLSLRRRAAAEAGAWLCAAVLVWLTVRWELYTEALLQMDGLIELAQGTPQWVMMSP